MIGKNAVDGVYGDSTAKSVKIFQQVFNLPQTGIVDYATWYKISDVYVGVTRIAELRQDNIFYPPMTRGINIEPHISYPRQ